MEWWHAIVLGVVEGITEYLPVSSTGHLILVQRALGIPDSPAAQAYAIVIQGGAIGAVLGLYYRRVQQMIRGIAGQDPVGLNLVKCIIAGFIPAAVLGLLLEGYIKEYLFGGERWGLWPTVAAWFVGGVAILIVSWHRKAKGATPQTGFDLVDLTWKMAIIIGFAQCLAMWPGTSRSLVTILGAVMLGMNLRAAVEFSFLLGVVTLGAATVYDALRSYDAMLEEYGLLEMMIGFFFAWASAVIAIKWLVTYLSRHGLAIFGYYRIALAIVVTVLILTGVMGI
jgi:undecaprenyl-diphosphatase